MKRLFTILMMAAMVAVSCEKGGEDTPTTPPADEGEVTPPTLTPEGAIVFADSEVKRICVENWDTNKDGELTKDEAAAVADLGEVFFEAKIQEFTELQYFTGLTTISKNAFIYCTVKKITLPDGIVRIKSEAFKYCDQLEEITIPAGVTSIEEEALLGCESMQTITVLATTPPSLGNNALFCLEPKFKILVPRESYMAYAQAAGWKQYDDVICDLDGNPMLIDFADSEVKRLCLENWDTSKGGELSYAEAAAVKSLNLVFQSNGDIKSFDELQYFTGLTELCEGEFSICFYLMSVTIPNSVTTIKKAAFQNCRGLKTITIPERVTAIEELAFQYCLNMESIYCKAINPPVGGVEMFGFQTEGRKIYVPAASVEAYKSAEYWSDYADAIVGYDF